MEAAFRAGLLQRESAVAIAEGAEALSVLGVEAGGEGDRIGAFVTTPKDGCLLVLGRGTRTIDDLDLLLFGDDGAIVASDEGPDPRPAIVLCGTDERRLFASVRVTQGRGIFALGVQRLGTNVAWKIGKALGAKNGGIPGAPAPEPWPGLDAKAAAFRATLGADWTEAKRQALPVDAAARGRASFAVEAGRCLAALVVPSDETTEIDVEIEDAEGRVMGRTEPRPPRDHTAFVCSPIATEVTLAVRPRFGEGVAAIVLLRGQEPPDAAKRLTLDAFPRGTLDDAKKALGEKRKAEGYGAPVATARLDAIVARRAFAELSLPAGCTKLDAVAGAPLAGLVAEVWTTKGELLGRADGGGAAALHVCGEAQRVRVEVEAGIRGGAVAVEARAEDAPRGFDRGAARALTRLAPSGRPAKLAVTKDVAVEADREAAVDVPVAKGACIDAAAGADLSDAAVELRVREGGEEIAKTRGLGSAVVRACAKSATTLQVVLRADARAKKVTVLAR